MIAILLSDWSRLRAPPMVGSMYDTVCSLFIEMMFRHSPGLSWTFPKLVFQFVLSHFEVRKYSCRKNTAMLG